MSIDPDDLDDSQRDASPAATPGSTNDRDAMSISDRKSRRLDLLTLRLRLNDLYRHVAPDAQRRAA